VAIHREMGEAGAMREDLWGGGEKKLKGREERGGSLVGKNHAKKTDV